MRKYGHHLQMSMAMFDEANKMDVIECMTTATTLSPEMVVIIGDPCQLKPRMLQKDEMEIGYMARYLEYSPFDILSSTNGAGTARLMVQYRCAAKMMRHISDKVYGGSIKGSRFSAKPSNFLIRKSVCDSVKGTFKNYSGDLQFVYVKTNSVCAAWKCSDDELIGSGRVASSWRNEFNVREVLSLLISLREHVPNLHQTERDCDFSLTSV